MTKTSLLVFPVLFAVVGFAADDSKIPSMPGAVSSNAVASIKGGLELYSLMGVGPRKTWDDITNKVYVLHVASAKWSEGKTVPGVAGRLGAVAIGAKGHIYVFGGYVVDGQGNELTLPDVNAYAPEDHRWYRAEDLPVGVDNAVIGINHDRYIYIVGGRSKNGPVNNVQVYDLEKNAWSQATPFPGTPVFGHAGGLVDDAIVYVDGAMRDTEKTPAYIPSQECWVGKIDHKDPNKIQWSKIAAHPGPAHFGIAAGVDRGKILFSGGTATPHNYKGVAYDGQPAAPSGFTFTYDVKGNRWHTLSEDTFDPRMDSRGILGTPAGAVVLGGMASGQAVTSRATFLTRK